MFEFVTVSMPYRFYREPHHTKFETVTCLYTWATLTIMVWSGSRYLIINRPWCQFWCGEVRAGLAQKRSGVVRIAVKHVNGKRKKYWFGMLHGSNRTTIKRSGDGRARGKNGMVRYGNEFGPSTVIF